MQERNQSRYELYDFPNFHRKSYWPRNTIKIPELISNQSWCIRWNKRLRNTFVSLYSFSRKQLHTYSKIYHTTPYKQIHLKFNLYSACSTYVVAPRNPAGIQNSKRKCKFNRCSRDWTIKTRFGFQLCASHATNCFIPGFFGSNYRKLLLKSFRTVAIPTGCRSMENYPGLNGMMIIYKLDLL